MRRQAQTARGDERDAINISLRGGLGAFLVVVAALSAVVVVASLVAVLASLQ